MSNHILDTCVQKFVCASFLLLIIYSSCLAAPTLNDSSKINSTNVSKVVAIHRDSDIKNSLQFADNKNLPVTIMGVQHSQGGQTLANHAVVLNMLAFNQVLNLDVAKKQVTVQSGMIWSDLQNYLNLSQLAIKSMQSPNIFTIGGSLSVNAHGDDFRVGSVGNSIVSFNMILQSGKKILVNPVSHPDLWRAVIGGYGLLGVVTDITLQLTDNNLYRSHYEEIDLDKFTEYFRKNILNNYDITLFYAHLNITPGRRFLREGYVITYTDTHQLPKKIIPLENPDKWNPILKPLFNISRFNQLGKDWRWHLEKQIFRKVYRNKIVTRNNAMDKPVRFAISTDKNSADWLQEYFIPPNKLKVFMDDLRKEMSDNSVNLLNVTIRYVPAEPEFILSYARTDCFSVVLYFNQSLSEMEINKTRTWTRHLIDTALAVGGTYYLTYQNFATVDQFKRAYPQYTEMNKLKKQYDPNKRFFNIFYQTYLERY